MAEKFNSDNSISPKELAKHLRQPEGETGKKVGLDMNKGNKHICLNSYKLLSPENGNHILEIGMGNGFFVKDLLIMKNHLKYTGVDFSETMVQEANYNNKEFIKQDLANFKQASIDSLPFDDNYFDCITTTNTIYFWPNPTRNIKELLRVLKPNGKLLIAYRAKSFMNQLELSKYGFEKYEKQDVEGLLKSGGFKNINTQIIEEPELEFDGKTFQIEGVFTLGIK